MSGDGYELQDSEGRDVRQAEKGVMSLWCLAFRQRDGRSDEARLASEGASRTARAALRGGWMGTLGASNVEALLERDREVTLLEDALAVMRCGVGRVIMIEGEAGIGKTALLDVAL